MELLRLNNQNTDMNNSKSVEDFDLDQYIRTELLEPAAQPCDMPDPTDYIALAELDSFFSKLQSPNAVDNKASVIKPYRREEPRRGRPRQASDTSENPGVFARRERNRQAAQRCRDRRLARLEELEAEIEILRQEKEMMMAELVRLGATCLPLQSQQQ